MSTRAINRCILFEASIVFYYWFVSTLVTSYYYYLSMLGPFWWACTLFDFSICMCTRAINRCILFEATIVLCYWFVSTIVSSRQSMTEQIRKWGLKVSNSWCDILRSTLWVVAEQFYLRGLQILRMELSLGPVT